MLDKCKECYEDNKTPDNSDCLKCDENYKRLEQENKELKEGKDKYYQQTLDDEILMNELSLEVDLRKKESDFYLEKLSKYRSALEEIREKIKSLNKDICNNCGWHNTDNCQPNGYVCHDLIEIKNKINEVLND